LLRARGQVSPRGCGTLGKGRQPWCSDNRNGAPRVTKDGVSVLREIELEDKLRYGAQMVREVAPKSCRLWRDGTTTATVLAQAIVKRPRLRRRMNPMDLKRRIDLS